MLARSSRWLRVAAVALATAAGAFVLATGTAQATAAPQVTHVQAGTSVQPADVSWW
jgi:hypothetical protein